MNFPFYFCYILIFLRFVPLYSFVSIFCFFPSFLLFMKYTHPKVDIKYSYSYILYIYNFDFYFLLDVEAI